MSTTAVRLCTVAAALFLVATPARAQQPLGQPVEPEAAACPSADPNDGTPLELRMAGRLLRVQVRDLAEGGDSARVQLRLVGCDTAGADTASVGAPSDTAVAEAGGGAESPLLRLMHDLRVGLELAPTEDGRCIRAQIAFDDRAGPHAPADPAAGAESAAAARGEPVGVELCGLPFPLLERPERP